MGLVGLFETALVAVFSVAFLYLSSSDFHPVKYRLPRPLEYVGPLVPKIVENGERILEGELAGPESLIIEGSSMETVRKCGRPLGLRRYKKNQFISADYALGIILINFDTEKTKVLLSTNTFLNGKRINYPDDVELLDEDTVVISDANLKYELNEFHLAFLENSFDGRIIQYKISTGEASVLLDEISFPNGIQAHPDKESLLICQSIMSRVIRYYFTGPRKGQYEIFVENLPGMPDNIRLATSKKSFWVALFSTRNPKNLSFFDRTAQYPGIRKVVGEFIQIMSQSIIDWIFMGTISDYNILVEVDLNGQIIDSYHDPTGKIISLTSEVNQSKENFFILGPRRWGKIFVFGKLFKPVHWPYFETLKHFYRKFYVV